MNYLSNLSVKYLNKTTIAFGAILLAILGLAACEAETDGGPLGPSNITSSSSLITVTPAAVTVVKNDTVTFTAAGGSGTFTWSVSNQTLGSIVLDTGVFTAGTTSGSLTVTATDENGSTGTATVTINNKTLTILPSTAQVGRGGTQLFQVTNGTAPVFFSINDATIGSMPSNDGAAANNQSTFTAGVTLGSATVTAVDSDGDTATATVTVVSNQVTLTPASVTFSAPTAQTFTASGTTLTYTFVLSGNTGAFTLPLLTTTTTTAAFTSTVPAAADGNQTLTLTATDSNGDTATSQITLVAGAT